MIGAAFAVLSLAPSLRAEDSVRLVLLKMAAKEAEVVRSKLSGAKPEEIDAILQRPGIETLADFMEANPWRSETVEMAMPMAAIEFDGEVAMDRGIKLELEGARIAGTGIFARMSSEIILPDGAKGYHKYQILSSLPIGHLGSWQEDGCWGDPEESLMIWRLATSDEREEEPKEPDDGRFLAGKVEMKWFKVEPADLATLAKSKPDTRDKAFDWLAGRGEIWKDCLFWIRSGERSAWQTAEGKLSLEKGEAMPDESHLMIVCELTNVGDALKFNWEIHEKEKGNPKESEQKISATVATGIWEFSEIKGIESANVVAWRFAAP